MQTILLWLRNDLRIDDHEALARAAQQTDHVMPVYCFDPRHFAATAWGFPKTDRYRAQFLIESIADLRARYQALGTDLVVRVGHPEDVLPALVRDHPVSAVYVHKETTSEEVAVEDAVAAALKGTDTPLTFFWGHTLYHPDDLPFAPADLPDVFTPFRKRVEQQRIPVRATFKAPNALAVLPEALNVGELPSVEDLGLAKPSYDERVVMRFQGGEQAGLARLDAYLWEQDALRKYKETRNGLIGADYSSKFSPWLAHGCLSPRMIYEEVKLYERERVRNKSTYWLIFELMWRDFFRFAAQKFGTRLFYPSGPMQRTIDWEQDPVAFERWTQGTTGFPFVDANMRELKTTGFMSNRGRQNVASFLTKNLNIDWRMGAAYFESLLVDYDVTSNWGNWAYVSGVGHDPRDRYFNIITQANRYDPQGRYVKRWCPELEPVPTTFVHEPYRLSAMEQQMYGFHIGKDYPAPMIDLDASYKQIRGARTGKG